MHKTDLLSRYNYLQISLFSFVIDRISSFDFAVFIFVQLLRHAFFRQYLFYKFFISVFAKVLFETVGQDVVNTAFLCSIAENLSERNASHLRFVARDGHSNQNL